MNSTIERTARIPFGITDNISCTLAQAILLYASIITIACWIFQRRKQWLLSSLLLLILYFGSSARGRMSSKNQHRLIVYNLPKKQAIDVMEGQRYQFISGDPPDAAAIQFHLRPARIQYQVREGMLTHTLISCQLVQTAHKKVIFLTTAPAVSQLHRKWRVDLVILSGKTRSDLATVASLFDCPQYVFDSSAPLWKIRQWKKQADSLHLRHHSVPELGAFEMAL
jgi:competence protein ComEC